MKEKITTSFFGISKGKEKFLINNLKSFIRLILLVFVLSVFVIESNATTFRCIAPKNGGTFELGVKSLTEKCDPIRVHIPAGSTAEQKAERIKNAINRSCVGIFTATRDGDKVTVTNSVHPNQRVFFRFGPDDTGEKDRIVDDLTPAWWKIFSTAPLYTVSASASGLSFDGVNPGSITIGTSTHVATIMTFPGQSPLDVLLAAGAELSAFGVPMVNIEEISPGVWGLMLGVTPDDDFVEFGNDDSGFVTTFEMFEETSAEFVQMNFNYDGTETLLSDWGAIDLTFAGSKSMHYLNLSVNGSWVIQNMPFLSVQGNGELQARRFWFPISSPGIEVEQINYSYTITPVMMLSPPVEEEIATIEQDFVEIYSGFFDPTGDPSLNVPDPAVNQVGGKPVQKSYSHRLFPNQEAGVNECVPTGISNSFKFLKERHGLVMTEEDMSIDSLKKGTGWTALGCPRPAWVDLKRNYVRNKKLPVTTRKLDGPKNIASIGQEIKDGQDVEMDIKWKGRGAHAVAITEWIDLGGGRYQLGITHDKEQGREGGTVTETAIYDSNTGTWTGALSNGTNDFFFVVECPTVRTVNTGMPMLPPGNVYLTKPTSGTTFAEGLFEIRNFGMFGIMSTIPLPPPGATQIFNYPCFIVMEFSMDGGDSFFPIFSEAIVIQRASRNLPPYEQFNDTELLMLNAFFIDDIHFPDGLLVTIDPDQPSLGMDRIVTYPGGFLVDSFFDIFFKISLDNGMTWFYPDNGSALLEVDGYKIQQIKEVDDLELLPGDFMCLDALDLVIIGGNVVVEPDASLIAVSNGEIRINYEFHSKSGSYFSASITNGLPWCFDAMELSSELNVDDLDLTISTELIISNDNAGIFNVFPNPTPGKFTLEFVEPQDAAIAKIEIFNIIGEHVLRVEVPVQNQLQFDLGNQQHGIYIIRATVGNEVGVKKIIRQ